MGLHVDGRHLYSLSAAIYRVVLQSAFWQQNLAHFLNHARGKSGTREKSAYRCASQSVKVWAIDVGCERPRLNHLNWND